MIQQTRIGLASRELANPYNKGGFLPLITAPMYSVVDETNYQIFLDNKIRVCLPRNKEYIGWNKDGTFISLSLDDFKSRYVNPYQNVDFFSGFECTEFVCVDCANGNIPQLHEAIRRSKEIHGDNLVIMAGNVSSVDAFIELAKTGVDYIRVGIGGGAGCNTTSNTGVGQENLEELIKQCSILIRRIKTFIGVQPVNKPTFKIAIDSTSSFYATPNEILDISNVKIVADGISSYIKQCESEYGFNDNGYAAINKLLFAGADLVMIGGLFAQCVESAGEKGWEMFGDNGTIIQVEQECLKYYHKEQWDTKKRFPTHVKYSGMSTQKEQKKYKKPLVKRDDIVYEKKDIQQKYPIKVTMIEHGFIWGITQNCANCKEIGYDENNITLNKIKPSEGSVKWIPVRWTLKDWLLGSDNQDQYPYLMGWVNSIKSAMAYCNKICL